MAKIINNFLAKYDEMWLNTPSFVDQMILNNEMMEMQIGMVEQVFGSNIKMTEVI